MRRAAREPLLLFAEDFDEPVARPIEDMPEPEPEIIVPVFSLADLEAARAEAADAAREATRAELAEAHRLQVRMMLAEIGQGLGDARGAAERLAELQADALAGLLIDLLRTALPNVCARHGAIEARAMLKALQPALLSEPVVMIHLHPTTAEALTRDMALLQAALPGEVRLTADEALLPGDVRVAWQNGAAVRDTQALLSQVDEVLGVAGLLIEQREFEHAG